MGEPPTTWAEPRTLVAIGSLVIAIAALLQPWIIALWKKYLRSGSVDVFNTGQIEIGYSDLGPTLGLHGTMMASDRNQFVHKVVATVTRQKDGASHAFEWAFFRGYQVNPAQPQTFELASGFLLSTSQPHRFNLFLIDFPVKDEMEKHLRQINLAWERYSEAHEKGNESEVQPKNVIEAIESNHTYQAFSKKPEHIAVFHEVSRLCYWEPGDYTLQFVVETALPEKKFSRTWSFQLTKDDKDRMLQNVVSILSRSCIGHNFDWNFAYAKYMEVKR